MLVIGNSCSFFKSKEFYINIRNVLFLQMWPFLMLLFYDPLHIGNQYLGCSMEGEICLDCSHLLWKLFVNYACGTTMKPQATLKGN